MEKTKKTTFAFSVYDLAEIGMLVGLALILNFIKIPLAAGAGSINLQLVPLFIICLRKGWFKGLISCGICYGLISCLLDNYGFATFPFDYFIGFGSCFILSFFRPLIVKNHSYSLKGEIFLFIGCLLSSSLRFAGGVLSSMIIYNLDFVGSLVYNAPYVFLSGAICSVVLMILLGPILKIDKLFPEKI